MEDIFPRGTGKVTRLWYARGAILHEHVTNRAQPESADNAFVYVSFYLNSKPFRNRQKQTAETDSSHRNPET